MLSIFIETWVSSEDCFYSSIVGISNSVSISKAVILRHREVYFSEEALDL